MNKTKQASMLSSRVNAHPSWGKRLNPTRTSSILTLAKAVWIYYTPPKEEEHINLKPRGIFLSLLTKQRGPFTYVIKKAMKTNSACLDHFKGIVDVMSHYSGIIWDDPPVLIWLKNKLEKAEIQARYNNKIRWMCSNNKRMLSGKFLFQRLWAPIDHTPTWMQI